MRINKLRMDALSREQRFVDVPKAERMDEGRIKQYVELFTDKLIHQQKKIHLLLTNMFIQELKIIHLFHMEKYQIVVTTSILNIGSQKSLPTTYNAMHKIEARDVLKYLKSIGVQASWNEVDFLIRRFLFESPYFRVPRPLRWGSKDNQNTESDETHFESVDLNYQKVYRQRVNKSAKSLGNSDTKMTIKHRYHPYEENQKKGYKNFMNGYKKNRKSQSTTRENKMATLDNFPYQEYPPQLVLPLDKTPPSVMKFSK
uniref:Uncharacterized protein n=1 Tax=Euplotes crassus TaxID=5936 RepID=A0A7S3KU66_EUPCR|mmetsp:Transcript_5691/g.5391  ORF Transcript_5691/g.5391 Transcript_5691/m.5391 type:complete len:257 (+) Transcript_5691:26-796(+)